ncbi:MFS transporter [Staphylococcus massiliensis]|uniref:MFS transporter n=1 Tax=Staphylococcus massiliensis TaxID=555791 RepID=UPI001EDF37C3|nr:MFS transporter [Staphylococcus massiliensis]MCG3399331.1 MFS transporter [Staphylococcus massiliensis]
MTLMRTITFILSIFLVGMVEMVVAGIMNLMSQDLHVSEALIGQLVTIYALTFAITGPFLVKVTEKYNPKTVLLWTLGFFILGNLIITISPNFYILIIGRILSSAAAALIVVRILALTVVLTTPKNRGKMLGIVYTGFSGSNVFGVPIGTVIGDAIGWRFTFLLIVVISMLTSILLLIYLPANLKTKPETNHEHGTMIKSKSEIAKYILITFLVLTANAVTYIYINPLIHSGGHDMNFISLSLFIIGIAGILGTALGGFLTDKLSSKLWLLIAMVGFTLAMIGVHFALETSILLMIIFFIWHITEWSTNPAVQTGLIQQIEGDSSQVMSWNMSSLNAGIGFGAMLGGFVVTTFDVHTTIFVSTAISILSVLLILSLKSPKKA